VEVELEQDLGEEVADLRPRDEQRMVPDRRPRALDADDLPGHAEPLGLEVADQVASGDGRERREPVIERQLVGRRRREAEVAGLAGGRTLSATAA
jgi:hypothetical protein